MFTSSKWPSEPKFCERYLCSCQKNDHKWSKNGHFWNIYLWFFFFQNWKTNLSRTFVIYVIDFDLIGISTCLTLLNDHQNLNFVKYIYVAGKKRPEIVVNWPYAKVVCFFGIQSLYSFLATNVTPIFFRTPKKRFYLHG